MRAIAAPGARDLPAAEIPTHREFGVRGIGEAPKIVVDPELQGPGSYELVTTADAVRALARQTAHGAN